MLITGVTLAISPWERMSISICGGLEMTNSIFAIMEYCMVRGLKFDSNLGRGLISVYDPESDNFLEIKADIDAKVTIERIESWLDEVRHVA